MWWEVALDERQLGPPKVNQFQKDYAGSTIRLEGPENVEFTLGWRWIRFTCEHYTFSMRTSFANQIPIIRHTQKCMITNYVIEHKARNI